MDWDFEAPGLHYFFKKTNADIRSSGTIELLEAYTRMMRTTSEVTEDNYSFFNPDNIISLVPEIEGGRVDLIPAGNYNDSFVFKVNNFDWYEFYELLDGKTYIEALKQWLNNSDYDLIFIDSRTGINDYSGICNIQFPDANVVVMAANNQNIDGCKRIIDQVQNSEYTIEGFRKSFILPILSRINVNHPNFNFWAEKFTGLFHNIIPTLDKQINNSFSREVFKEFYLDKTLLPDDPQYSVGENLLFTKSNQLIPRNSFVAKFANLSEYILNISRDKDIGLAEQIDTETWLRWAENAEINGEFTKASVAYEKGGKIKKSITLGGTANAFIEEGNNFLIKGNKQKAVESYQKALTIEPNAYAANFNLGVSYAELGDNEKAIECYQKALIIETGDFEAYFNMGIAYDNLNNKEKAIECYEKAIDIKPDFYQAYYNMGGTYSDLGEPEKTIEYCQQAIVIDPKRHEAYVNLGFAFIQIGKIAEAELLLIKGIQFGGTDKGSMNLGHISLVQGKIEPALVLYRKSLEAHIKKDDFWKGMQDDFQHLQQYGVTREQYDSILNQIQA